MSKEPIAIFVGRFQPFHIEHLDFVRLIVASVSTELVIAVIVNADRSTFESTHKGFGATELQRLVSQMALPSENPFTYWERFRMIKKTLDMELGEHNIHIIPFLRPDIWWDISIQLLPPNRVWVLPNIDSAFDRMKLDFLRNQGEGVKLLEVNVSIHGSDIREMIRQGKTEWMHLVPSPTLRVLQEMDGVQRITQLQVTN